MKINIRLLGEFGELLSPGSENYSGWVELDEGTTIGETLKRLKIPESIPMIILVNGIHRTLTNRLNAGDVLNILPPMGGG